MPEKAPVRFWDKVAHAAREVFEGRARSMTVDGLLPASGQIVTATVYAVTPYVPVRIDIKRAGTKPR